MSRRRSIHAVAATAAAAGLSLMAAAPTGASPEPLPVPPTTDAVLSLTDVDFGLDADDPVHLVYSLANAPAELLAAAVPTSSPTDPATDPATTNPADPATTAPAAGAPVAPPTTLDPATAAPPPTTADPATTPTTTGDPDAAATDTASGVTTPGDPASAGGTVQVAIHPEIDSTDDLEGALAGDTPDARDAVTLDVRGLLAVNADGTVTMTLDVPTSTLDAAGVLQITGPGIYPVTTTIMWNGTTVARHQTFVRRLADDGDDGARLTLSVVAGVDDPGPDPDAAALDTGMTALRRLDELGRAVSEPLTVAIPPPLLDHAATADPELAAALATTLDGDELFALPAESVDPSALAAIGAGTTFTRQLTDGEDIYARLLPGTSVRRTAWLAGTDLSTGGAELLRDLGARLLVMSTELYESLPGNIGPFIDTTSTVEVSVGTSQMEAMVVPGYDDLIGTNPDIRTPTERSVELLTRLLVARTELGDERPRAVVLSTSDLGIPDPAVLGVVDRMADDDPTIQLRPLSYVPNSTQTMLVDGEPSTVSLPATAGVDLRERADAIAVTRTRVTDVVGMLDATDTRPASWNRELDNLLSTAYSDDDVTTHLAAITADLDTISGSVELPPPFDVTLTGRSNTLRLRLTNRADTPLTVIVRPRSSKLQFPDGDPTVTVPANDVIEVEIPVEARANGRSPMSISLFSPSGAAVGSMVVTVNVRSLAGLGQVITGGAVAVLVSWWASHAWRRRRRQRPVDGDEDDTMGFERSPDADEVLIDDTDADSVTPL